MANNPRVKIDPPAQPVTPEQHGRIIDLTGLDWGLLPIHALRVSGPLKAIKSVGGLQKGHVYHVSHVTNKGQLALVGNSDRLFPMDAFVQPRLGTHGAKAESNLLSDEETDNG